MKNDYVFTTILVVKRKFKIPVAISGVVIKSVRAQPPIPIGEHGYYHPEDEQTLCKLVQWAHGGGARQVRVRGALHAYPNA